MSTDERTKNSKPCKDEADKRDEKSGMP